MSGQHTPWGLKDEVIAYASSHEGRANCVISKAQFDNALPKNRTEYDVPLGHAGQAKKLAAARALLLAVIENENSLVFGPEVPHPDISYRIRAYLDASDKQGEKS